MKSQQQHWLEETIDINLNFLSAKIQSNSNSLTNLSKRKKRLYREDLILELEPTIGKHDQE